MVAVLKWVYNIAAYLILITIILQVIPKRFRKYISFFTGVLLIMLVISPVAGLFDAGDVLADYFEIEEMRQALSEMEDMIKFTENVSEEKLIDNYSEQIKNKLAELIKEYGFRITDVQIGWNLETGTAGYGSMESIYVVLDEKHTPGAIVIEPVKITIGEQQMADSYTENEIKEMKKIIADFCNLDAAHINIMIQG